MATAEIDPLLFLRHAIAAGAAVVATATDAADAPETPLPQARFLQFAGAAGDSTPIPVDAPTRFLSNGAPVDLRSIYFAWLNREVAIHEYNAAATRLNEELATVGLSATVHKFAFVERLDLITWLEGASEESEYIKAVGGPGAAGAGGAAGGAKSALSASALLSRSRRGQLIDPRLAVIYSGERHTGDHNTVLRGIKPTVRFDNICPFILRSGRMISNLRPGLCSCAKTGSAVHVAKTEWWWPRWYNWPWRQHEAECITAY